MKQRKEGTGGEGNNKKGRMNGKRGGERGRRGEEKRGGEEGRRKRGGERGKEMRGGDEGRRKRGGGMNMEAIGIWYTTYQFMACHRSLKLPVKRAPGFDGVVGCRAG